MISVLYLWTEELLKAKAYPDKWTFGVKLVGLFYCFRMKFSQNSCQLVSQWHEWLFIYLYFLEVRSRDVEGNFFCVGGGGGGIYLFIY